MEKQYDLVFSDLEFGHPDLGFIKRKPSRVASDQAENEDWAFAKFLRSKGHVGVSVRDGVAKLGGNPYFSEIPQFPRAHYAVDISWDYLEQHIKRHTEERSGALLDLEPDFQRAHVWSKKQQIAYVEYVLQGGEVGRNLTFNCAGWMSDWRGPYVIVDGKQRLEAVRAFLRDEFKAFGHKHSEFQGHLSATGPSFSWRICTLETREELLKLYLSINAGGTPHTKAELDRVRALLNKDQ